MDGYQLFCDLLKHQSDITRALILFSFVLTFVITWVIVLLGECISSDLFLVLALILLSSRLGVCLHRQVESCSVENWNDNRWRWSTSTSASSSSSSSTSTHTYIHFYLVLHTLHLSSSSFYLCSSLSFIVYHHCLQLHHALLLIVIASQQHHHLIAICLLHSTSSTMTLLPFALCCFLCCCITSRVSLWVSVPLPIHCSSVDCLFFFSPLQVCLHCHQVTSPAHLQIITSRWSSSSTIIIINFFL